MDLYISYVAVQCSCTKQQRAQL